MNFSDLQKMFKEGSLTEDTLIRENVSCGDFIKMREDTEVFSTASYAAEPGKVSGSDRTYRYVYVTESAIGYFKDVPLSNGWNLKTYRDRKSPILFGHDQFSAPIGRGLNVKKGVEVDNALALVGNVEFAPEGIDPRVDLIEGLVGAGFLNGGSVGFDIKKMREPTKDEVKKYKLGKYSTIFEEMDLIEYSIVSLGRDPKAGVIYTDEGAAKFEGWIAENIERFNEEDIREVRESLLCVPSTKSFHALRNWTESTGDWAPDPATGGPITTTLEELTYNPAYTVSVMEFAEKREVEELKATVQKLSERVDGFESTEEVEEEETLFGLPVSRIEELCLEEICETETN